MRRFLSLPVRPSLATRFASSPAKTPRILITGANGQIGSELAGAFRGKYGVSNVVTTDIAKPPKSAYEAGPFEYLDVLDSGALERLVVTQNIDWVIHLSAMMSVVGEAHPQRCIELNVSGLRNVLEASRKYNLRCFAPSTMAAFSEESGKTMTKDVTIMNPTTVYGITKVFLEQLGSYYHRKFGVDFRCLRYPGIISANTLPGGGTSDYAVWMYHYALEGKKYACPVAASEPLPMLYMPDCLDGTVQFITAERETLLRCVYNISGMSFSPDQLHRAIQRVIPEFSVDYEIGIAQEIANSWPDSMDDSNAKRDFGWSPKWDIDAMTDDMIKKIRPTKQ